MNRGKYIVLEGPEGVGKTTQLQELARRLQAAGLPVRLLREPDSQSDLTARAIRQLTQDPRYPMNTRTEVLLYNAARSQSLQVIKQSVEHGVICLVDRNYLTTLAIQYYGRGDVPDYQTINSIINFAVAGVEPDLCILLDAPVNVLHERLADRYQGDRFDGLSDAFLERVRAGYLWEAHQRQLPVVFATDEADAVADRIWQLVSQTLAVRSSEASQAAAAGPSSVKEIIDQKQLPEPPVVQVPGETASEAVAASSDIVELNLEGVSYLSAPYFLQTAVATLATNNGVVPDYYMPDGLPEAVQAQYREGMEQLFAAQSAIRQQLTQQLGTDLTEAAESMLQAILPLATLTTINVAAHRTAVQELVTALESQELPEIQAIAESLMEKHVATDDRAAAPAAGGDAGAAAAGQLRNLVKQHLPDKHAPTTETATLTDFWPRNELLLVADMLYEHSNQSLEVIQSEVNSWPYSRKAESFQAYLGRRTVPTQLPGRALQKAHYSWELITDYLSFISLRTQAAAEACSWQSPSPRFGYAVPAAIEQAGLTEQWENCFEISLKLHSYLVKAGHSAAAAYVTLLGHQLRWTATYNGLELLRVLEAPALESVQIPITRMLEKLTEVHPLIAENVLPATV